jgi:hypothetical protein
LLAPLPCCLPSSAAPAVTPIAMAGARAIVPLCRSSSWAISRWAATARPR